MPKFEVAKMNILGNSNVGVYMHASDAYALVVDDVTNKDVRLIQDVLNVEVVHTTISGTRLIGVMAAGNSNGILLPSTALEEEIKQIKKHLSDINIGIIQSRNNALGNLIVANDRAAIIYPHFEDDALRTIRDVLGVEVIKRSIAGIPTVGSVLVVTNKGGLVHPDAEEEEIKSLSEIFKVPILTGTVNFGVSFVRIGLVANSHGAIVGEETQGPEIARIHMALGGEVE
ncbi:MAG: translation initiation factor IF-6 [Desulfurococcales archaeon]|nr:translation initiation factor IF-6 [Desulfurococcales archaeon]